MRPPLTAAGHDSRMDVRTEISYPGANVAGVFALVLDPDFRAAVCEATMALEHHVDVRRGADGSAVVTVTRTMPAAVPDFARRLVGDTVTLHQVETWQPDDRSSRRRAALSLEVVGQPARMTGSLLLAEEPGGVRELVSGDLSVSLPFIGRRIEAEIAKGILAAARKEEETGRAWLAANDPT
jgi:hypothetical protein